MATTVFSNGTLAIPLTADVPGAAGETRRQSSWRPWSSWWLGVCRDVCLCACMMLSLLGPRLFRHPAPASSASLIDITACCPSQEAHQLVRRRWYNKLMLVALIKDTTLLVYTMDVFQQVYLDSSLIQQTPTFPHHDGWLSCPIYVASSASQMPAHVFAKLDSGNANFFFLHNTVPCRMLPSRPGPPAAHDP